MGNTYQSRRQFVKKSVLGTGLIYLPDLISAQNNRPVEKKKIICVGAHPDDPESGCGGTLALLANAGHQVTVIYITTGERGIKGKSFDEAAIIRKKEAINACAILNAKPVFAGQINGDIIFNYSWINKLKELISAEKPDIVFSHWPIDSHEDHGVSSLLTIQTWLITNQCFSLYFFEVCIGAQSMIFHPTDYVDISETQDQKKKAVYCHISQDPSGIYDCGHTSMEEFRGREFGVAAAEAFVHMTGRRHGAIPFIKV